jgi:hypothetical protein
MNVYMYVGGHYRCTCEQDIRSPKSSREDMTKLSKTKSKDKHRDHSEESQKSDKYAHIHTYIT